jgi:hypothetical protein
MFHELQSLLVLAHRRIESVGSLLSTTVRTIINTMVEPAPWSATWTAYSSVFTPEPFSAAALAGASFAGFLLLVRYLHSANRQLRGSYSPQLPPKPNLSVFDILVSVATGLIGLALCWATG